MQCVTELSPPSNSTAIVYVVEPDVAIRDGLATLLTSFGIPNDTYADSASFLETVSYPQHCCLLVDAEQSGVSGFNLLKIVREHDSKLPVVMIVDQLQRDFTIRAILKKASGVLEKPFTNNDVIGTLQRFGGDRWPQLMLAKTESKTLASGEAITLRPMQPSDRDIEQVFVRKLSPSSRVRRFFSGMRELSDSMLDKFTHIHYPDNIALIATTSSENEEEQIGVARYIMTDNETAEFAIAVADAWQRKGIGRLLMCRLIECVQSTEISTLTGTALGGNLGVKHLAREMGFDVAVDPTDFSLVTLKKTMERAGG